LPPSLAPAVAAPFPLVVRAVGSTLPIGNVARTPLKEESVTAYEVAYTGTFQVRTTVGAAFYVNDMNDSITFVQLPSDIDPYTPANPPPGWPLPPSILGLMAQQGVFLPRTAFSYSNLGPTRQKGLELSIDHRLDRTLSAFANYSWQGEPQILDDPHPFPYNGPRFLGALTTNHTSKAFWSDVLTPAYYGFTDGFTTVGGSFGVRWDRGRITTSIKATDLFNQTIQQHVFGDLMRRSVIAEVRFDFLKT
jgi:outer membrane receptor protein involved in Fe transport